MKRSKEEEENQTKSTEKESGCGLTGKKSKKLFSFLTEMDYELFGKYLWNDGVNENDPGVFIVYNNPESIHYAMTNKVPGVLPAGLLPGANPVESSTNLRNWLVD